MSLQLAPLESQRRHWYAKVIGWVPLHAPGLAVSVCPTVAVPEIVGGDVLPGGDDAGCTTGVAADVAVAAPAELVAVTATRKVSPTSSLVAAYVELVELMGAGGTAQLAPLASQRCHWYV